MQKSLKNIGISMMSFLLVITGFATNVSADNSEVYHNEDMSVVVSVNRTVKDGEVKLDFESNTDNSIKIENIKIEETPIKNNDYRYSYVVGENGNYKFIVEYTREVILKEENIEPQVIQRNEKFEFSLEINEIVSNKQSEKGETNPIIENTTEEPSQTLPEEKSVEKSPNVKEVQENLTEVINGVTVTIDSNGVRTLSEVPNQEDLGLFITENEFIKVDNQTGIITIETVNKSLSAPTRNKRSAGATITQGGYVVQPGDTVTVTWRAERSYKWVIWGGVTEIFADGSRGYCWEPGIVDNISTSSASGVSIDDITNIKVHPDGRLAFTPTYTQRKNVELISNYGRKYPGHETDAYEWATKKLIWIELGWDVSGGPNVDYEMSEIQSLIAQHTDVPSWDGDTRQVRKGDVIDLSESGLNKFNINYQLTSGLEIIEDNGNTLKVKINEKNASLVLNKKGGSEEGTSYIYSDGSSQKVGIMKLGDPVRTFIDFEVKSGNLEIEKKNNFNELLEGVSYEFSENADMSNPFSTKETNSEGKVRVDDIDEGKVIYYREKATIVGHVLDTMIYNATIISGETVNQSRTNTAIEGQAKLIKTDGNKKLLDGVVFGVYNLDGTLVEEKTTDANGEILTSNLRYGDYYFKEHKALSDYWTDETPIYFSIREHKEVKHVTMANKLILVHLEWKKTDEDGLPLAGVGFKIRNKQTGEFVTLSHADGKNVVDENIWYTDANGDVFVKGLIGAGTYELVEVSPLEGYQPISPISFTVDDKQDYIDLGTIVGLSLNVGEIVNYWNRGNIKVGKIDEDTKAFLPGFGFNVYNAKGEFIGYHETDADGTFTLEDVRYGLYTIEEVKVNGDYGIDQTKNKQEIFVEEHGKTYELTFENKHADIKTSASFVERDKETPNIVTITDKVSYTDLWVGKEYTVDGFLMIKETNQPLLIDGKRVTGSTTFTPTQKDGFVNVDFTFDQNALNGQTVVVFETLKREVIEVVVHHDINDIEQTPEIPEIGTTLTYTERDKQSPNIVTLTDEVRYTGLVVGKEYTVKGQLQDGVTGLPLLIDGKTVDGQTTFIATQKDGIVNVDFTFDQNKLMTERIVAFERLEQGERLIAVHANLEDKDQTVEIYTIRFNKRDSKSHKALPFAEFTMEDMDGNILDVQITDESGIADFKVVYGEKVRIYESGAPVGYIRSDEVVTIDTTEFKDGTLISIYYDNDIEDVVLPKTGIDNPVFPIFAITLIIAGLYLVMKNRKIESTKLNPMSNNSLIQETYGKRGENSTKLNDADIDSNFRAKQEYIDKKDGDGSGSYSKKIE